MPGMFDDIDEFLKGKRKPLSPEDKPGMFDEMVEAHSSESHEHLTPKDLIEKLKSSLGKELGIGGVEIEHIDSSHPLHKYLGKKGHEDHEHAAISVEEVQNRRALVRLQDGLEEAMRLISRLFANGGVAPYCLDAGGVELSVGDRVNAGNGDSKTVLSLGFGYCVLSHTDDQSREDGTWFQSEIIKHNFTKK